MSSPNPVWWLSEALARHDQITADAADAGLVLQDIAVGVTGGSESNPDYVASAKSTTSGISDTQSGSALDDAGYQTFEDGLLAALQ